jgi:hypothetical protein
MTFQKISKKDYKISESIEIMAEAEGLQHIKCSFRLKAIEEELEHKI